MSRRISMQIRVWPWSADAGFEQEVVSLQGEDAVFPHYGSPLLEVDSGIRIIHPRRHEKFAQLGRPFRTDAGTSILYEIPHVSLQSGVSARDQHCTCYGEHGDLDQHCIRLAPTAVSQRTVDGAADNLSELAKMVMAWHQTFDDWSSRAAGTDWSLGSWEAMGDWLRRLSEEEAREPRMSLIVQLADRMHRRLESVVAMARKILVRERAMLPVERIVEMDTACLRWYIRQPGRNMAQKAAMHRQCLAGITRYESYDTLENRVLKDFLVRCHNASRKYLAEEVDQHASFKKSHRAATVRHYNALCGTLLQHDNMREVTPLTMRVRPNYVLQNDQRYRAVWREYQRLLRQEQEEDRSWDWQSRTWTDISRLLLSAALAGMGTMLDPDNEQPCVRSLMNSSPVVFREQHLGARIAAGSEPGPFALYYGRFPWWIVEIVHPELVDRHPAVRGLPATGASLYLVLNRTRAPGERRVILLWAVHTAASDAKKDWRAISVSAAHSLQIHQAASGVATPLAAIVMASSLAARKVSLHHPPGGVPLLEIPADPNCWGSGLADIARLLHDLFSHMAPPPKNPR